MGKSGHENNQIFRITAHVYKSQRLQNIRSLGWLFTNYNSCLVLSSLTYDKLLSSENLKKKVETKHGPIK